MPIDDISHHFQISNGCLASQPPTENLKFERADWTSFRTVEGLQQKAGVAASKLRRLVQLCKAHGRVGVIFTLQPPGTKVKTRYAHAAIVSGALRPRNDGLFGHVQTWVIATLSTSPSTPHCAQCCPRPSGLDIGSFKDRP